MCGRFYVSEDGDITPWIDEANRKLASLTGENGSIHTGEMFPTDLLAVIANGKTRKPSVFPMKWGYHIPGRKSPLINARIETAGCKPLFKESFGCRRCLIPADHYFEWGHEKTGKGTKYAIRPDLPGVFYLAGLYRFAPDSLLPECVILTREPVAEIISIHNRMPLIIGHEQADMWLRQESVPDQRIFDICWRMIAQEAEKDGA